MKSLLRKKKAGFFVCDAGDSLVTVAMMCLFFGLSLLKVLEHGGHKTRIAANDIRCTARP
jgi:hypothetical protein